MKYEKPEITVLGDAVDAILGSPKSDITAVDNGLVEALAAYEPEE